MILKLKKIKCADEKEIADIDWDKLYYVYCVVMGRPEEEFYNSSLAKVVSIMNMQYEFYSGKNEKFNEVKSMRDIKGLIQ